MSNIFLYITDNRLTPHFLRMKVILLWLISKKRTAPSHRLSSPLTISLTSYPKRFKTLHLTLYCLLSQSIQADQVILWIATADYPLLPDKVTRLQKHGLLIKTCDDLKSYKKIIPFLENNIGDSFVVTADDDIYYWKTWLEELVNAYPCSTRTVISHRTYRVTLDESTGNPNQYSEWLLFDPVKRSSSDNFFTGCGGVLFNSSYFYDDTLTKELFQSLCPTADDIWLNWMVRLSNCKIQKIKSKRIYSWPDSQKESLTQINVEYKKNDQQILDMISKYGNVF